MESYSLYQTIPRFAVKKQFCCGEVSVIITRLGRLSTLSEFLFFGIAKLCKAEFGLNHFSDVGRDELLDASFMASYFFNSGRRDSYHLGTSRQKDCIYPRRNSLVDVG